MSLQQENPINLAAAIFPHQALVQCIQKKTEEDSPHEPELAPPPTIKATSIGQRALAGASEASGIPKTMDSHVVQPSQSASPDSQSIPEDYAIEAVVSQPHLLAHIFAFLEGKDAAHAEQACHTFQNGRHLANIQRVKNVAALWGIEDLSFSVEPTSHIRLTADDKLPAIIDRLREINSALPERFRSHNFIDVASSNPSWLLGFFQRAYDCQVLSAFGRAAHVAQQSSFETQLHTVFEWLEKGQSAWLLANKRGLLMLPYEISLLPYLQLLDVSNNLLESLPSQIDQLSALQVLDVSHNKLKTLPLQISALKELLEIDISNNQLETLPEALFRLPNLRRIDVRNNHTLVVPEKWVQEFRAKGGEFLQ